MHLCRSGPLLEEVLGMLMQHGFKFESFSEDAWRERLRLEGPNDAVLAAALPLLERISFPPRGTVAVPLPCNRVHDELGPSGLDLEISEAALQVYVKRWIADG